MPTMPALKLVRESKICDLLPRDKQKDERWEASGVLVKGSDYFVVFDDRVQIARISNDLEPKNSNGLFGVSDAECGFEGITYNAAKKRFYLLVESRKQKRGSYKALIVEYDDEFRHLKDRPADFTFKSDNKGFEAVAHVRRDNKDYLLALCEGNKCQGGSKGRKPGGGRVQLFVKERKRWRHLRDIALPNSLPFVDYSGMSIDNGRMAIVSQVNSMLWIGQFDEAGWKWARLRSTLRVSPVQKGHNPIREYRRSRVAHAIEHRDCFGPAQEKGSAGRPTLRKRPIGPYFRDSIVARCVLLTTCRAPTKIDSQ